MSQVVYSTYWSMPVAGIPREFSVVTTFTPRSSKPYTVTVEISGDPGGPRVNKWSDFHRALKSHCMTVGVLKAGSQDA